MHICCLGISHKIAPVEIRERLAVSERDLPRALAELRDIKDVSEAVVLSTCNRVEIYAALEDPTATSRALGSIADWLSRHFRIEPQSLPLYRLSGRKALEHIVAVASGLDSMVLGETEIFGQVKKAYASAHKEGATGRQLNQVFQKTFQTGKLVRTQTGITRGATSVGAVGVDLAEKIFGDLRHCRILIIGAGEMSRRTAQSLQSRGATSVFVSNRSFDRAEELAKEMNGKAIRFDAWDEELARVDIIISSTTAPHHVVTLEKIKPHLRHRRGRPLFMIDISVPRDIDPELRDVEGIYLYDIDTLQKIADTAKERRKHQLHECRQLIARQLDTAFPECAGPSTARDDPLHEA